MAKTKTPSDAVYFLSLSLENVRCFGSRQTLDLSDGNGRPARWTVILGDNGTGKTTLLQVLAGMTFTKVEVSNSKDDLRQLRLIELRHSLYRLNDDDLVIEAHFATGAALDKKQGAIKTIALNYTDNQYYSSTKGWNNDADKIKLNSLSCHAYGANRNLSKWVLSQEPSKDPAASLFNEKIELINAEEWLLQSDYIASKESEIQAQAQKRLDLIKDVLISLLPDVKDIRIRPPDKNTRKPIVVFKTLYCPPNGWLTLKALSLGYQTMIAWMVDLAAHLFQRYPNSPNPIAEPAVVLIDEIDLHLHPKWQRTIMSYLSERFVNTQFIVTAHSPLIVQAAEQANIVVLKREGDEVHIHQQDHAVRGWRIDQLLTSDLFDLKSARSPHYEDLLEQRRKILSKPKLTKTDQARLKKLETEIGDLPTAETPEDIQAMDIIRRAAEILKSNP